MSAIPTDVLIVTATAVETRAILAAFPRATGEEQLVYRGANTYRRGEIGGYSVTQIETRMGSQGPGGSHLTISDAISECSPRCIIMVGIAFSMRPKDHKIGDVLVAAQMVPYEIKRIGEDCTIHRGDTAPSDATLLDRFTTAISWRFSNGKDQFSKIRPGAIVSGAALIDNELARNALIQAFPNAIGGEMEGVGLYSAAHRKRTPWILIKGVCDFADGKKRHRKAARQQLAASAAADLCLQILQQNDSLNSLVAISKMKKVVDVKKKSEQSTIDTKVLFDVYRADLEPYYIPTSLDSAVSDALKVGNIWVHGGSGFGKTCSVFRNSLKLVPPVEYIDLSMVANGSPLEIATALYNKLEQRIERNGSSKKMTRYSSLDGVVEAFVALNNRSTPHFSSIIFDEWPQNTDATGDQLCRFLIQLLKANEALGSRAPRIAVSSLGGPDSLSNPIAAKLSTLITHIPVVEWSKQDLERLIHKCESSLPLKILKCDKNELIRLAKGNPRVIKSTFRGYISRYGIIAKEFSNYLLQIE